MKSAYFWINLPTHSDQTRKFIAHPPVPDGGSTQKKSIHPIAGFRHLIQSIVQVFSAAVSHPTSIRTADPAQLKMQQCSDSRGHTLWYVYDPIAKRIACIGSMAEVQAWLNKQCDLTQACDREKTAYPG